MGIFLASWQFERKIQIFSCHFVLVQPEIEALVYTDHNPDRGVIDHGHQRSALRVKKRLLGSNKISNVDIDLADIAINRRPNDCVRQLELCLFQVCLGFLHLTPCHLTRNF